MAKGTCTFPLAATAEQYHLPSASLAEPDYPQIYDSKTQQHMRSCVADELLRLETYRAAA